MATNGGAMTMIYLIIILRFYPRIKTAVAAQNWPAGGAAMDVIRRLGRVNLVLGTATVAIAVLGP